jgi:hypothetical protein
MLQLIRVMQDSRTGVYRIEGADRRPFWMRDISVVRDARVVRLLDESIATFRRWHEDRSSDRTAFDRMKLIHSPEFARSEANKLSDLLVPAQCRLSGRKPFHLKQLHLVNVCAEKPAERQLRVPDRLAFPPISTSTETDGSADTSLALQCSRD